MSAPFPEPTADLGDTREVLLAYLDFFRSSVAVKLQGLTDEQLRSSLLPSGWSPLELVKHLASMERRWLVWGFLGEETLDPWDDHDESGRWHVGPDAATDELLDAMRAAGRRTRDIVHEHALTEAARHGGRFPAEGPVPTLERVLFHVLQEYARHLGHLDVVRELLDGTVGE